MTKYEIMQTARAALQHRAVLPSETGCQAGWPVGLAWSGLEALIWN